MKSPERADLAVCLRAEPVRRARAAQRGFVFPWAMLLNPTVLLGIALAAASGFGWLQTVRLGAAQDRLGAVQARYDQFRAQVASEGQIAQQKADMQAAADKLAKEKADNEAKKRYASLDAAYAAYRLRQRAGNSATSSLVPAATSGTTSGSAVCYSRDALDREIASAIGRLYAGIADDAQPYDTAVATARTCKEWATAR